MKDYLLNKNIGLIDLNEIELNAFEIENDISLSHLGDSDEEFDNLVCNILTLDPENNSEVKPYQHRAILVLDPKTDELMAEYRNVKEASRDLGIPYHTLRYALKNNRDTCGIKWLYKSEYLAA